MNPEETLGDIISQINQGKTDKEIALQKGNQSPTPVYKRLIVAGATKSKSSGCYDFSNINKELLDSPFWKLPTTENDKKPSNDNNRLSEHEVNTLKKMIEDYNSKRYDYKEVELLSNLFLEQAPYKSLEDGTKQLNVPLPDTTMQRLDRFISLSGLEKRYVIYKSLAEFLDVYEEVIQKR